MTKKAKTPTNLIARNKKATFDYFLQERFEAGIVLQGWEVKCLREKGVQLRDTYVLIKDGEAWLLGAVFKKPDYVASHLNPDPQRTRKLLLHRHELKRLGGVIERKGHALVATSMYWKKGHAKVEIALAKGKKEFDKRDTEKDRDWKREKERLFKQEN
ncbi:SsrA-binding protein SmpB [Candidatus Marithioploca araucensis]|uniref:SsrA-binding protein n=1 Tax=Candidatus Marithioploca araucensis TaxID=70273 RepID=A0ABT7VQX3_9GAMM|nr:SsrA-binding protein SmpB [Thiotrichales bacterium HSG14]MDM8562055.1 SsrA-binding protein SmpB [Candidatus Marithioploca araucensis]